MKKNLKTVFGKSVIVKPENQKKLRGGTDDGGTIIIIDSDVM